MQHQDLLVPENLHSVKGLELLARSILDGHHSGLHNSRKVGQGMEFSQYRSYEPGDDLRLLDWKMLARSSRYYIKQAEVDTSISIKFIIDTSASMQHEDAGMSKIDYCRLLCATIGYLAKQQGDAIGLFTLNDQELKTLYPNAKVQQFNRFLHHLVQMKSVGKWPANKTITSQLHDPRHKELIIFLSDMYEEEEELTAFLNDIKTSRNEVILFHLLAENELELSYKDNITLLDLETKQKVKVNREQVAEQYAQNISEFVYNTKNNMLRAGIEYSQFSINAPIKDVLNSFINRRSALL